MRRRAVFLDRDGTLVHAAHYPSRPQDLHLYDDIGPGLRSLQSLGFCLVVITNQAGIARGYFSEADLQRMHVYLRAKLALWEVHLDGIYYCPHHPEGVVTELAVSCACRKPQPGMLLQAARDLDLDLRRSWFVGDILDDVEAGNRAGCRTILVDLGTEPVPEHFLRSPAFVAPDTRRALEIIKTVTALEPDLDLVYRPATWLRCSPGDGECHPERSEGSGTSEAKCKSFTVHRVPGTDSRLLRAAGSFPFVPQGFGLLPLRMTWWVRRIIGMRRMTGGQSHEALVGANNGYGN